MKKRNVKVVVPVPSERLGEFYALVAAFFDPSTQSAGVEENGDGGATEWKKWVGPDDQDAAIELWARLSEPARVMFTELATHPGQKISGQAVADVIGIDGPKNVAGVLAWPGRHCYQLGYTLPIQWGPPADTDPGAGGVYWMTSDVATLFTTASAASHQ